MWWYLTYVHMPIVVLDLILFNYSLSITKTARTEDKVRDKNYGSQVYYHYIEYQTQHVLVVLAPFIEIQLYII